MESLSSNELVTLVERVFAPRADDRDIAVLIDLPDQHLADHTRWRQRREMASDWAQKLSGAAETLERATRCYLYRNVRTNNADLPPDGAWEHVGGEVPSSADDLDPDALVPWSTVFARHTILLAPTELSATAPMKLAARSSGIRAATMPGFFEAMIPSLRLDYTEIDRRCRALKAILDEAHTAAIGFSVDDGRSFTLALDLRHRSAHASGGLVREPGTAGNLPSGETYIVPYEGELDNDPSQSQGLLPVDLDGEVVVYRIERNTAVSVESSGPTSEREQERLIGEPAYGNMAELGLGLLADFGVEPVGEILLDEKLAPHIAFGRSDHFGGQVGAAQFSAPEAVVHIDRVYQPRLQPRVQVARLDLLMPSGAELAVVRDGHYVIQL
jgi:hypothetical protein